MSEQITLRGALRGRTPVRAFTVWMVVCAMVTMLGTASRSFAQDRGLSPIASASGSAPKLAAPSASASTSAAPLAASSASSVASSSPIGSASSALAPLPPPSASAAQTPPPAPSAELSQTETPSNLSDPAIRSGTVSGEHELPSTFHYTLESIQVRGNNRTRDRVVLRYVQFRPGTVLDVDDPEIELTRFRLLGTGFFQSVSLSLKRGTQRGAVVLVIDVVERNTIVVNDVWLGLSASGDDAGHSKPLSAYGGADVAETNLGGTGITLGGAFALAEDQVALRLRFLDPAILGSSWMAQTTLLYNSAREFYGIRDVRYEDPVAGASSVVDFAVARYKRFGGSIGAGRDLSVSTQVWFDYRLEAIDASLPLAASDRRGLDTEPINYFLIPGKSVLSTIRGTLIYDTRDGPILPTRGYYIGLQGDVSLSPLGSSYPFQKLQIRLSRWWPIFSKHVIKLELFGGAIGGNAPVYEKFYVTDFSDLLPDRVLDLNTDRRPAPNFFGTDIAEVRFGDYAAKAQVEYRIPLYRGSRSIYGIDIFTAAGLYAVATKEEFSNPATGYSGLSRIPVDFTFNLGLRMDTKAGGFVLAFANALGFVPVLRGQH